MQREEDAVKNLRSDHVHSSKTDWCDRLPTKVPQRPTLVNVAERIEFEERVKKSVEAYENFTGTKVDYDLETLNCSEAEESQ